VQKIARELSLNFHTHRPDLPGTPDLVFYESRTVVFVHGCFWHSHSCRPAPKENTAFWERKRDANVTRDTRNVKDLQDLGWKVLTIWECATRDEEAIAVELLAAVEE